MKKISFALLVTGFLLAACTKNDQSQSTAPADYAETHDKLIQNNEKDSAAADSAGANTSMPPQTNADVQNK